MCRQCQRPSWIPTVVCWLLLMAGCGTGDNEQSYCGDAGAGGSGRFPGETLADWKSYADHLAIFTIRGVKHGTPPPGAESWDRGLPVSTLRIDRVVWSAPNAPKLPTQLKWRRVSDKAIGDSFLSPVVYIDDAREWGPLTACAPMRLDDANRVLKDEHDGPDLAGLSVAEIADRLRWERPHPLAHRYRHLRPAERVRVVLRATLHPGKGER